MSTGLGTKNSSTYHNNTWRCSNMQEKFALTKTLRKVAAVGTSLALVGVTVSGALAAGLGDLPSPFTNNSSNTVVVYGSQADNAAVQDVVDALGGMPSGGSGSGSGSTGGSLAQLNLEDFENGERKDIDVGNAITSANAGGFSATLDETDGAGLKDGKVAVSLATDTDYDYHEAIAMGSSVFLGTALDPGTGRSIDEDYGSDVLLFIPSNQLTYNVIFEENMDAGNFFANATSSNKITTDFLGQRLQVIGAGSAGTTITAYAGDLFEMKRGDSVVSCGGKTVSVSSIDTNSAVFRVDGSSPQSINEGNSQRVGGCEIFVENAIDSNEDANDVVIVALQKGLTGDAIESYTTGSAFIGEDDNTYLWAWNLSGLNQGTATSISLGVSLHEDLNSDDTDDLGSKIMDLGLLKSDKRHLGTGDYLCLPNRYSCLVLEGQDGDWKWNDYIFEDDTETLYETGASTTYLSSASALRFRAIGVGEDKGFTLRSGRATTPADISSGDTASLWFYYNNSMNATAHSGVQVFSEDKTTARAVAVDLDGNGTPATTVADAVLNSTTVQVARFDNGDYNSLIYVTVPAALTGAAASAANRQVTFTLEGERGSNLTFYAQGGATGGFTFLGDQAGEDSTKTLSYGSTLLSGYDKDMRKSDAVVVKDPKGNIDSDSVKLSIPNDDDFEYWVRFARPKSGVVSTTTGTGSSAVVASLKMMDTEVGAVSSLGKNVVAVGGPCVNAATREVLGLGTEPKCGADSGLTADTAMLELKSLSGGKMALLVYGWEADDTRRAALVVKNPARYKSQLDGKNSATIRGPDLDVSNIQVTA